MAVAEGDAAVRDDAEVAEDGDVVGRPAPVHLARSSRRAPRRCRRSSSRTASRSRSTGYDCSPRRMFGSIVRKSTVNARPSWSTLPVVICVSGEWRFSSGVLPNPPQPTFASALGRADRRGECDSKDDRDGDDGEDRGAGAVVHRVTDRTLLGASWPGSTASTTSSSPSAAKYGVSAIVRCCARRARRGRAGAGQGLQIGGRGTEVGRIERPTGQVRRQVVEDVGARGIGLVGALGGAVAVIDGLVRAPDVHRKEAVLPRGAEGAGQLARVDRIALAVCQEHDNPFGRAGHEVVAGGDVRKRAEGGCPCAEGTRRRALDRDRTVGRPPRTRRCRRRGADPAARGRSGWRSRMRRSGSRAEVARRPRRRDRAASATSGWPTRPSIARCRSRTGPRRPCARSRWRSVSARAAPRRARGRRCRPTPRRPARRSHGAPGARGRGRRARRRRAAARAARQRPGGARGARSGRRAG